MSGKINWQKSKDNSIIRELNAREDSIERLYSIYEHVDSSTKNLPYQPVTKKKYKVFKGGYTLHYVHESYLDSKCTSIDQFEKKFKNQIKKLIAKNKKEYTRPIFTKFPSGIHKGKTYQHVFDNHFHYFMWFFWVSKEEEKLYMIQNIDMEPQLDFFFKKAILDD